jgi:chemotaxis signal transduction protein
VSEQPVPAPGDGAPIILLQLAGSAYALPARSVREIVRLPAVTRVPGLPAHVAGLANVRGRVLCVLDLRPLLGLEPSRGDRLVIIEQDGVAAGLVVDAARDLIEREGPLEPLPPGLPAEALPLLAGLLVVGGEAVAMLVPDGVFALRTRLGGTLVAGAARG